MLSIHSAHFPFYMAFIYTKIYRSTTPCCVPNKNNTYIKPNTAVDKPGNKWQTVDTIRPWLGGDCCNSFKFVCMLWLA
jgi:hypothetical protein